MPNQNIGSRLEEIVGHLGKYYGAMSRSDFVSLLLMGSSSLPSTPYEVPDASPARVLAQAFLDMSEGAFPTPSLIQKLNEYVGAGTPAQGPGDAESTVNDIPGLVKICYEPALIGKESDKAGAILRKDLRPQVRNHNGNRTDQGAIKDGDTDEQAFSIRHIGGFGVLSAARADQPAVLINETGTPTDSTSHVDCSIIQVFANRLAPASRDMGALTLFMNAMPTLEISRAVPFVDVVLIQEGNHFSAGNRVVSLSQGQFLLGNAEIPPDTVTRAILGANDAQVAHENSLVPEFERSSRDSEGNERVVVSPIATAGMELFTSPQTLVNSDEEHLEPDVFSDSDESQRRRQVPVIDKFRPLMSLKSVSFQVVGTGGMMSYKSAKMSLVLHDRSRLAEVSALVRPSRYGTTHLMLEYGWSHPDAPAQSGFSTLNQDNLFGSLIGALRVKEKYQVVNSSFDFDEAGQVNIELQLSMLSNRALQRSQIGLGIDNVSAFQQVKYLTDMIQELRNKIPTATAQSVFGEADVLGSLTSPQGALTPMSNDTIREIRKLIALRNSGTENPQLRRLGESLANLMGSSGNGSDGAIRNLKSQMRDKITQRVNSLVTSSDPFFVAGSPGGEESTKEIKFPEYVSLGKIFASFILEPIAASGHYKDVQVIFYNFNDKASYMANRNIATYPISKADFQNVLTRELDQLVNMPVESFINFLGTYFISDPASDAYGFNSMYSKRPTNPEEDSQRQLAKRYEEDDVKLFEDQQKVLRNAYGRPSGELEFKQPTISLVIESVPVRGSEEQTILRMHIVDSQCTAHSTVQSLLEAASSQAIGLLNTKAIAAQQALGRSFIAPDGSEESAYTPQERAVAEDDFTRTLNEAVKLNLLERYTRVAEPGEVRQGPRDAAGEPLERYRIKGGFGKLKNFIMKTVPSVRYGEGSSGILSAKVSSMNDAALTTVNIMRQGRSPENPIGSREQGVPLQVSPVECSLETIGCPLWSFGQQIFLDMGTGTTIDAVYGVTGVDHTIEPGSFKTAVRLTPMSTYARYTSLIDNIEHALVAIDNQITGDSIETPPAAPRANTSQARRRQSSGTPSATGGGGTSAGSPSPATPTSPQASPAPAASTSGQAPSTPATPPSAIEMSLGRTRSLRAAALERFTSHRSGLNAIRNGAPENRDWQAITRLEEEERALVSEYNRLDNEVKRLNRDKLRQDLPRKEQQLRERGNALAQLLQAKQALETNSQARNTPETLRTLQERERTMRQELEQLGREVANMRRLISSQ